MTEGILHGPYSSGDWNVMLLLKRQIARMEKKNNPVFEDLLRRDKKTYSEKYLLRVS